MKMTKKQPDKQRITIQDRRVARSGEEEVQQGDSITDPVEVQSANAIEDPVQTETVSPEDSGIESGPTGEIDWEQQARENLELAQRKQAALDNFRKRAPQDREDIR